MKLEKLLPWNANAPPHRETICETRNRPLFHLQHKAHVKLLGSASGPRPPPGQPGFTEF